MSSIIYKDGKRTLETHDREGYKYLDEERGAIFYFNAIGRKGRFLEFRRLRSSSGFLAGVINKLDGLPRDLLNEFERIEEGKGELD
jgi:hypothetical protein